MSDESPSRDLRGLSRAVDDLFSGRESAPAELPPPLFAPRPEVEGLMDEGVAEVGWAGEEDPPPPGPGVHVVDAGGGSGVSEEVSAAGPDEHPGAPGAPVGGGERRGQGTALRKAMAAFVAAPEAERAARADAVRREVERLRERRDGAALADAVERLIRARPDDAGALALAAEMVGPGVAGVLTARLREAARDEARQEELVAVIGHLGDEMVRAVADALTMTDDRAERRSLHTALTALAPGNQEIVVELLDDPRWFVVRNAVQVIGEIGDGAAVEYLTAPLGHEHPKVRREAVVALARIGGDDAGMLVQSRLEDPAPEVRSAAALALGELGVQRGRRALMERLEEEDDVDVVVQILRALGALGDPAAVPVLERRAVGTFFSRPPAPVRVAAYRALAAIGSPHARRLVEAAVEEKDSEVRGVARFLVKQFESGPDRADGSDLPGEPADDGADAGTVARRDPPPGDGDASAAGPGPGPDEPAT